MENLLCLTHFIFLKKHKPNKKSQLLRTRTKQRKTITKKTSPQNPPCSNYRFPSPQRQAEVGLTVYFLPFESWTKKDGFSKKEKKQQRRNPHQQSRAGIGNKYKHKHQTWVAQHLTAPAGLCPPPTDLGSRRDHRCHLSALPPMVCHTPTCK